MDAVLRQPFAGGADWVSINRNKSHAVRSALNRGIKRGYKGRFVKCRHQYQIDQNPISRGVFQRGFQLCPQREHETIVIVGKNEIEPVASPACKISRTNITVMSERIHRSYLSFPSLDANAGSIIKNTINSSQTDACRTRNIMHCRFHFYSSLQHKSKNEVRKSKNHSNHIAGSEQVENSTVTAVCTAQIIVSLVIIPAIGSINIDCHCGN